MSQKDEETSISEVEAFCTNSKCREPIVVFEDDGYTCKECTDVFCQTCIEFIGEELKLENLFDEETDGFCPSCAKLKRLELHPSTEKGKQAIEDDKKIRMKMAMQRRSRTRLKEEPATKFSTAPYQRRAKK